MFTKPTEAAIAAAAHAAGIEPQALLAIAELESGGIAFASIDGRPEPLIRFEAHVFDRQLAPAEQARARAAGLASPVAGRIANPPGQTARWRLLDQAAAIDRRAAYEAVSWGIGQVMGVHWKALGEVYSNVDDAYDPSLARERVVTLGGVTIHVSHGHELGRPTAELALARYRADVVVFGHTHKAVVVRAADGRLAINGDAGPHTRRTAGVAWTDA